MQSKPYPGPSIYKGFNFSAFKPAHNSTMELFYSVKFIKNFITPWTDLPAYKMGILDLYGNEIKTKKDIKTEKEKEEYSSINRLAWEFRRKIQQFPGVLNDLVYKLWNLLVSKFVVKESISLEAQTLLLNQILLWEEHKNTPYLKPGYYRLLVDLLVDMGSAGDIIEIKNKTYSIGTILGKPTYIVSKGGKDAQTIIISDGEYQQIEKDELTEEEDSSSSVQIANTTNNLSAEKIGMINNLYDKKNKYKENLFTRSPAPFIDYLMDRYCP